MEFTATTSEELTEKLEDAGYDNSEIDVIVSMFEDEEDGTKQTITVAAPN